MTDEPAAAGRFEPTHRVRLGRTDVQVTQLAIGTVPLSGLFDESSREEAPGVLEAAWESGVRTFDVAPLYGYGFAERVAGEFLGQQPRDSYVLSTKVGRLIKVDGPPQREDRTVLYRGQPRFQGVGDERPYFDFTYDGVMRSLEASRERTGIERFDILHIHDPEGFMDEAVEGAYRALDALRRSGEVGAIGVGANHCATHVELIRRCDIDCILLAGRYSLLDQQALVELLPLCEERGVAVIAAGVYNSGILSHPDPGSIREVSADAGEMRGWKDSVTFDYEPARAEIIERAALIKAVCDAHGVPLSAAALQFPLHHPAVACVLVGPREPAHVSANNGLLRTPLPDALWTDLKDQGLLEPAAPTA